MVALSLVAESQLACSMGFLGRIAIEVEEVAMTHFEEDMVMEEMEDMGDMEDMARARNGLPRRNTARAAALRRPLRPAKHEPTSALTTPALTTPTSTYTPTTPSPTTREPTMRPTTLTAHSSRTSAESRRRLLSLRCCLSLIADSQFETAVEDGLGGVYGGTVEPVTDGRRRQQRPRRLCVRSGDDGAPRAETDCIGRYGK